MNNESNNSTDVVSLPLADTRFALASAVGTGKDSLHGKNSGLDKVYTAMKAGEIKISLTPTHARISIDNAYPYSISYDMLVQKFILLEMQNGTLSESLDILQGGCLTLAQKKFQLALAGEALSVWETYKPNFIDFPEVTDLTKVSAKSKLYVLHTTEISPNLLATLAAAGFIVHAPALGEGDAQFTVIGLKVELPKE
jgi:hypothetical protein